MKVVLVEDNQTLQKSITKVLTDKGHGVQVFYDGESARMNTRPWMSVFSITCCLSLMEWHSRR